jgi:hypothetical protein
VWVPQPFVLITGMYKRQDGERVGLSPLAETPDGETSRRLHVTRMTYSPISPPQFWPFQFVRSARRNALIGCGSCHEVRWSASSSARLENDAITHMTSQTLVTVCKNGLGYCSHYFVLMIADENGLQHILFGNNCLQCVGYVISRE